MASLSKRKFLTYFSFTWLQQRVVFVFVIWSILFLPLLWIERGMRGKYIFFRIPWKKKREICQFCRHKMNGKWNFIYVFCYLGSFVLSHPTYKFVFEHDIDFYLIWIACILATQTIQFVVGHSCEVQSSCNIYLFKCASTHRIRHSIYIYTRTQKAKKENLSLYKNDCSDESLQSALIYLSSV